MTLLTFDHLSLDFGEQIILKDASFSLVEGERVCLIGRNGAGKSTLLRIVAGEQAFDRGEMKIRNDLRISKLAQALPDAFLPDLAKSLSVQGDIRLASGLTDQAIESYLECASVLKPFAEAMPDVWGDLFDANSEGLDKAMRSAGRSEEEDAVILSPFGGSPLPLEYSVTKNEATGLTTREGAAGPQKDERPKSYASTSSSADATHEKSGAVLAAVVILCALLMGGLVAVLILGLPPGWEWADEFRERIRGMLGLEAGQ
jgi:energy-coupling factor transporter ATP-binding protein EcfA2